MDILEFKIRECFIKGRIKRRLGQSLFLKRSKESLFFWNICQDLTFHMHVVNDFSKFQLKCFGQSWEMFWHPDFQILPNVLIYHHNSQKYLWKKTGIVWFNASKCVNYPEHSISSQWDFWGNIPKSSPTPSSDWIKLWNYK